jgi:two-component system CheB/CheR fusion protein
VTNGASAEGHDISVESIPLIEDKLTATPDFPVAEKVPTDFPIVGIGASAGGLEAFEQFFRACPNTSGMAFVLVQHLDPNRASLLPEILQRATAMPVKEVDNQMPVMPNCVYVIPPNRDMVIFHRVLQLRAVEQARGTHMAIDGFLCSLATDVGKNAVGIILSGTGTDGTHGLRAIVDAGGIAIVQEPATAKYDGMPMSAIKADYSTYVLPPEKMMAVLLARSLVPMVRADAASALEINDINHILMRLRAVTGHDFSQYKKSTIDRRIKRRMLQNHIDDRQLYARFLNRHPAEAHLLLNELLINVTSFFRDPDAFVAMKEVILPQLLADKPDGYVFRVWVAGCASGEEAYTIAMLLREVMDEMQREFKIQLYGTDLDGDAIAIARAGCYPATIAQDVSPERLRRFFVSEQGGYQIKRELRQMVVFAVQNVIQDPPFINLDLLSCRNLMIYLEPELQRYLLPVFHYAINPGGVLFLSPSESIGNYIDLFAPINRKWKFYRATRTAGGIRKVRFNLLSYNEQAGNSAAEEEMKNDKIHRPVEGIKTPSPPPRLDGVPVPVLERKASPVAALEIPITPNGHFQTVSFNVRLRPDPAAGPGVMRMSFQDAAGIVADNIGGGQEIPGVARPDRYAILERELANSEENLQATLEEQVTSNEELKSANEELQSTNEELQSTNEELETSKEELQSLNEQLISANAELQGKIEQLADVQNDMKNLFDNIAVGTIFLGQDLCIRRFTREATQIYHLVPTDVGRHLSNIKSNLENDNALLVAAQTVFDSRQAYELELRATGGAWILVRIKPYLGIDSKIDGVVLTFTDVSERIRAVVIDTANALATGIGAMVGEPLVVLNDALQIVSANMAFYQDFQITQQDAVGWQLVAVQNGMWNLPALCDMLEALRQPEHVLEHRVVEHDFPDLGYRKMRLNARRVVGKLGAPQLIVLTIEHLQ